MKADDHYQLGYITKPHGLDGTVSIKLEADDPGRYASLQAVFVGQANHIIPQVVEHIRIRQDRALLKLEGVNTLEQASELRGKLLFLPLDMLPELHDGQFYYHEIVGFTVIDSSAGVIGEVTRIMDNLPQPLIVVQNKQNEVLIPLNDDIVEEVNKSQKELRCKLPEGLLDIYLS